MKSLEQMTNVDKAELIFSLFPEQKEPFIKELWHYCNVAIENKELEAIWKNGLITYSYWSALCKAIKEAIEEEHMLDRPVKRGQVVMLSEGMQALVFYHVLGEIFQKDKVNKFTLTVRAMQHYETATEPELA